MNIFRRDSSFVVLLGLVTLIAVGVLTSGFSFGMVLVFLALFGGLKLVMGLKTWWHALLGGTLASLLWIGFGESRLSGPVLAVLPALLAMAATLSVVKIGFHERRSRALQPRA